MELAGDLGEISLPQLIENICLNEQTGRLSVKHSQQTGTFSFQEGELVDAEFGEDAGPEAVCLAMSLPADASYEFEPGIAAARRTIDEPWQRLVLKGFCRLKKVTATRRSPTTGKGVPAAESEGSSLPSLEALSPPPPPPPPPPSRQHLSVKSIAVAALSMTVIGAVVGAAVVIASYSGNLGEGKRFKAGPSSITQSPDVLAAPAVTDATDAGAEPSPKMAAAIPAQSVAGASGGDSAAGQAESQRTDEIVKQSENTVWPTGAEPAGAPSGESKTAPVPADGLDPEAATTGDWFVILKTFPKKEQGRAAESGRHFRGLGHDVRVIDTDSFPNFRGGMWAVMLGPYSHETATEMVRRLRTQIPDVYAKRGAASSRRD